MIFFFVGNESHPNILLHSHIQLNVIRVKGIFGWLSLGGAKRSLIRSTTKSFTNIILILPIYYNFLKGLWSFTITNFWEIKILILYIHIPTTCNNTCFSLWFRCTTYYFYYNYKVLHHTYLLTYKKLQIKFSLLWFVHIFWVS